MRQGAIQLETRATGSHSNQTRSTLPGSLVPSAPLLRTAEIPADAMHCCRLVGGARDQQALSDPLQKRGGDARHFGPIPGARARAQS